MNRVSSLQALFGCCLVLASAAAPGQTDPDERIRAEFVAALTEAREGLTPASPDSRKLRDYLLYPYLQAARLEWQLLRTVDGDNGVDATVSEFLDYFEIEPVARGLRRAWLASLMRRGLNDRFLDEFDTNAADAELDCHYLSLQLEAGTVPTDSIRERWLTGSQLPIECEPVFQWARDRELIDVELVERRVRLLLANGQAGFARIIASRLPPAHATPLLQWAELVSNPSNSIGRVIAERPQGLLDEALLDGWARLSRDQPDTALRLYESLLETIEPGSELASELSLALALGLAWDRRGEALTIFDRVDQAYLDDYAREWRARAAMWSGDWILVRDSIASMSPELRDTSVWRYWLGRAFAETRERRLAEDRYRTLLGDDNFYSALAAARLGERVAPRLERHVSDTAAIEHIEGLLPFRRARELLLAGLPTEARREWNYGYRMLSEIDREQAVHLASRWDRYDWSVAMATEHGIFFDYPLLYPTQHRDVIDEAAHDADLEPALVLAVIRQESLFDAGAVSSASAIGLMQLQPSTAVRAAGRISLPSPARDDLLDPVLNIRLGTTQLRALLNEFGDQLGPALAGYNAGYYAAERWLPDDPKELDVWVENIPYNETRAYVRRVFWHSLVYRWLETERGQSSRDWLIKVRRP